MRSNNPAAVFPDRAGTFMRPASHKDIDRQAMEQQMSDFVLRMYDTLPHAELARDALLAAGYGTEQVQIEAMNSEAGPVQGNFTVGDRSDRSDHSGIGDSGDYGESFRTVRQGAIIKLTVAVENDARHAQAMDILDRVDASAS